MRKQAADFMGRKRGMQVCKGVCEEGCVGGGRVGL